MEKSRGNCYVIALDFGYPDDVAYLSQSSIRDLAEHMNWFYDLMAEEWQKRFVFLAQSYTYEYLRDIGPKMPVNQLHEIAVGQSNTAGLKDGGSYHVLKRAREMILEMEWKRAGKCPTYPLSATLVAHELHVRRAVRQGELLKMELLPCVGLPTKLYSAAAEWWCRSEKLWYLREVLGWLPLKIAGQL